MIQDFNIRPALALQASSFDLHHNAAGLTAILDRVVAKIPQDLPQVAGVHSYHQIFADVAVKHATPVAERPVAVEASDLRYRGSADALLGPENEGWGVGMNTLTNERGSIGAAAIGTQRRLDALAAMGDGGLDPHKRQRLASLLTHGKSYAYMGGRQGPGASVGSSLNKLGITELMFHTAELRADIAGPAAMLDGGGAASLLGAPGGRIAGGSSQVQRNIIGERILGLPKEPSP